MTLDEFQEATKHLSGDMQIMIQTDVIGPSRMMIAAQHVHLDGAGSKPLIVVDLIGQPPSTSCNRVRLDV